MEKNNFESAASMPEKAKDIQQAARHEGKARIMDVRVGLATFHEPTIKLVRKKRSGRRPDTSFRLAAEEGRQAGVNGAGGKEDWGRGSFEIRFLLPAYYLPTCDTD